MFGVALLLSLVGLALGPALFAIGRKQETAFAALDGFTLGLVPALLLLRLLPHLCEDVGPAALLLAAIGFAGFWVVERRSHKAGAHLHHAVLVPAMAVHSLLDGGSLALAFAVTGGGSTPLMLGGALVLHRLPEGLLLATALTPRLGFRRMVHRVALIGAATVVGALGGRALIDAAPHALLDSFVALGLGVMLRLAVHRHAPPPKSALARGLGGAGFLVGLAIPVLVQSPESILHRAQPGELSVVQSLGPLFVETSPAVLLGLAGVALLRVVLSRRTIMGNHRESLMPQALRASLSCCRIPACFRGRPVTTKLVGCGAPVAATMAFLGVAPQLHPAGAALSLRLLGVPLSALLASAILAIAGIVAFFVARASRAAWTGADEAPDSARSLNMPASLAQRWRRAASDACGSLLGHTGAWYLLGLALAAALEAGVDPGWIAAVPLPWHVVLSALLALPVPWCGPAAVPVALVLIHKGASIGAAVTFLAVATLSNGAVLAALRRQLGLRAAVVFGAGTSLLATAAGFAANALLLPGSVPELHVLAAHRHSILGWASALMLAALLAARLLRLGPQGWLRGEFDALGGQAASGAAHSH